MNKIYTFITILFFLISCGETEVSVLRSSINDISILEQFSPKERNLIVANSLFSAVVNNESPSVIDKILSDADLLFTVNKKGDTALGLSIQLKRKNLSLFLLEKLNCKDLFHLNNKGESYVYLASRQGDHHLIHLLADICYKDKKEIFDLSDYEFSELDPETLNGEKALHIASNATVAETLKYEYQRGAGEYPWMTFHTTNEDGETFFHTAVKENRISVLTWGVKTYCDENSWERSSTWFKSIPAVFLKYTWHISQTYLWNLTQLINAQNKEGNTALHQSAQSINPQALRIISHCRWTDYNLENALGNTALQELLKSLDPTVKNHSQELKDAFIFLANQKTKLRRWYIHTAQLLNHKNKEGNSALHLSASIADDFFYNFLKKTGDIYLKNKAGQTPEELFKIHRSLIQAKIEEH